jgi:hypothetical protein
MGWIPRPVSWLRTIVLIAISVVMGGTLRSSCSKYASPPRFIDIAFGAA